MYRWVLSTTPLSRAGSAGSADRRCHEGVLETDALCCQAIHVWCLEYRIHHAEHIKPLIVGYDKEDVWAVIRSVHVRRPFGRNASAQQLRQQCGYDEQGEPGLHGAGNHRVADFVKRSQSIRRGSVRNLARFSSIQRMPSSFVLDGSFMTSEWASL